MSVLPALANKSQMSAHTPVISTAVSSAPFVATLVDVTGLIIYFSIAFAFLKGVLQ